jgi:hypothetical protein
MSVSRRSSHTEWAIAGTCAATALAALATACILFSLAANGWKLFQVGFGVICSDSDLKLKETGRLRKRRGVHEHRT